MNKLKASLLSTAAVLTCLVGAQASTVTTTFTPGDLFNATGIDNATVGSDSMAGMAVQVCFTGILTCETAIWDGAIGASGGDFSANDGWTIQAGGIDTFIEPFVLSVAGRQLESFTLYGLNARTVFDTWLDPSSPVDERSPGSGNGRPFELANSPSFSSIAVNYFDKVYVDGVDYGDLYLGMRVDLTGVASDFFELEFLTDTDKIAAGSTIAPLNPLPNPIPLPGSLALAGVGLAALGAASRKRRGK